MLRASERPNEEICDCGQATRRKVAGNSLPDVYRAMRSLQDEFRFVEWLRISSKHSTLFPERISKNVIPVWRRTARFWRINSRRHTSPINPPDLYRTLSESAHCTHPDFENQPKSQIKATFANNMAIFRRNRRRDGFLVRMVSFRPRSTSQTHRNTPEIFYASLNHWHPKTKKKRCFRPADPDFGQIA